MSVLLSIKPKYANAILSGEKKFEFRRKPFKKKNIDKIYLYSNDSVQKIVGYFKAGKVLEGTPEEIWKKCEEYASITEKEFFNYFEGTDKAYAIKIEKVHKFSNPIDPFKSMEDFFPPQSFYYISDTEIPANDYGSREQIQTSIKESKR